METALIVPIPEAESLVARFRDQYDPAAAEGVPAHVTVLYPFLPADRVTADVTQSLATLFASLPRFEADFLEPKQFPGVLYLPPRLDTPFRRLTEAVFTAFPEAPPYGGRFADVVPHLTVADVGEPQRIAAIAAEFEQASNDRLPIRAAINAVVLIEKRDGRWHTRTTFPLARVSLDR